MTRLEALRTFTANRIRDAWVLMGSKVLPGNSLDYIMDDIFQLNAPGTPFHNAIMFSSKTFINETAIDWNAYHIYNATDKTIADTMNIIHPSIFCLLTGTQLAAIPEPFDPMFRPFNNIDPISISEEELNTILLEVGIPFITFEELEYSREDILKYMIKPAMKEYFKWFPIITIENHPIVGTNFDIPIPPYAFTASRVYLNPGYPITSNTGNPLARYFDEVLMSISPRGSIATPNLNSGRRQGFVDVDNFSTYIMERAARQGVVNYGSRTRVRVQVQQGRIKGYTTKRGMLEIEWAQNSTDWDDIPFNRQSEVRELAKAYILRGFYMLRTQAKSDIPGVVNYDHFNTRANTLEEKIITLWREATKAVIIRN